MKIPWTENVKNKEYLYNILEHERTENIVKNNGEENTD